MDEICSMSSKMHDLETENEEVRSMMETQSVQFESSVSEIANVEAMKKASDQALSESEAQTTAMRDALVSEISRLTAEMSKYAKEVEELQDEKKSIDEENKTLHEELTLSRREVERARLQGTMSNEEMNKKLHDTEDRLVSRVGELQHKFEIERNIVDKQKRQIDNLEQD